MDTPTIGFIGTGNMARAILEGLLNQGYPAEQLWATRRSIELLDDLKARCVNTTADNDLAIRACDVIVVSVKPQMMEETLSKLSESLQHRKPLLISVAAGISVDALNRWSGGNMQVIRAMPNTPSLVGQGACGLFAGQDVSESYREIATQIAESVGIAAWVPQEIDIDKVTAVSGSGPAYYFLFMEKMIEAGKALGLDEETATRLTLQTAAGAAEMASSTGVAPAELRRRVTSPGGTTEQAILSFERDDLGKVVDNAMQACANKAADMTAVLCENGTTD